jgi:hypothetical protein
MNYSLTEQLPDNMVTSFVIGFMSAYPSIMPTILSLKDNPSCELYKTAGLEDMSLQLPFFYGFLHVFLIYIINYIVNPEYRTYWLLGFIIGLIYPTFGTISGHAKKVYGIKSTPKLYLSAQALYLVFYGLIMNWLMSNMS